MCSTNQACINDRSYLLEQSDLPALGHRSVTPGHGDGRTAALGRWVVVAVGELLFTRDGWTYGL